VRPTNEAVCFPLELVARIAFGWWGWDAGSSAVMRIAAAVGLQLRAAVVCSRHLEHVTD